MSKHGGVGSYHSEIVELADDAGDVARKCG